MSPELEEFLIKEYGSRAVELMKLDPEYYKEVIEWQIHKANYLADCKGMARLFRENANIKTSQEASALICDIVDPNSPTNQKLKRRESRILRRAKIYERRGYAPYAAYQEASYDIMMSDRRKPLRIIAYALFALIIFLLVR